MARISLRLCLAIIVQLFYYDLILFVFYLSITQCPNVRRDSLRVWAWCWRRIPVDMPSRAVEDSDAHFLGFAYGVPTLLRSRRCIPWPCVKQICGAMEALETHRQRSIYPCGSQRTPVSSTSAALIPILATLRHSDCDTKNLLRKMMKINPTNLQCTPLELNLLRCLAQNCPA
jgi:hypothetical protein